MKEDIKIAKTAGFCMGVRRAVEIALEEGNKNSRTNESIKTFGPLIHNPQVLKLLEDKKIECIEEIPDKGFGTIIIRAHGIPPQTKESLITAGFKIIDATCPRVIKVQAIIKKHSAKGFNVIIVGDHDHAEVIGLAGYAGENGVVINSIEEFEKLPRYENAIVVAQTTQNTKFYDKLEDIFSKKYPHYKFYNTICDSTEKRQNEIKEIARLVDTVIVVGGKTSGNTKRLQEVAAQEGIKAFHIENEDELDLNYIGEKKKIGITAGASTPNWVITQIYKAITTAKLKKEKSILLSFMTALKFLLRTNILLALGAGALTYAGGVLQDISPLPISAILTASLYIFSIHTINNITLIDSDRFNDPQKALMYEKFKIPIFLTAISAGLTGIYLSFQLGIVPFLIILLMSGAGLCYKLPIINIPKLTKGFEPLSTIPGAKAFIIAGAWGVISTFIPFFSNPVYEIKKIPALILIFIFTASMAFFRTAWFDTLAIQGNKIAGEHTLPIIIGEKKVSRLLKYLLIINIFLICAGSFFNIISNFGYLIALYPCFALGFIITNQQKEIQSWFYADIITESMFIISGILAFIWAIF